MVGVQAKQLTREQYAENHPAGRIGKRLTLRVADVMLSGPALPVVPPHMPVLDVLAELSAKSQVCSEAFAEEETQRPRKTNHCENSLV